MALITCPECENKISDSADSCPQCGYKLTAEKLAEIKRRAQDQEIEDKRSCISCCLISIGIAIIITIIAVVITVTAPEKPTREEIIREEIEKRRERYPYEGW